jgi:hypothetical protein
MKILFLDHDGVICLAENWGGRAKKKDKFYRESDIKPKMSSPNYGLPVDCRFDNFDKKAIAVLNKILEETDAEIVVSSDWKNFATVEEMGDYYEQQGIAKKPIAFTPDLKNCEQPKDFPWQYNRAREQCRTLEILQYLREHTEITHWVAVDDLQMQTREDWGLENFVLTPKSKEGIKQCGIKEKIINYLK